jgi:uncharacterized membrane protein YpjA
MKTLAIIFFTFICVAVSTASNAQTVNAISVSPGKAVVSYTGSTGNIQIVVMENGVNLGVLASPFVIIMQSSSYTAISGLTGGKSYKFQVISNGVSLGWSNAIVPF